MKKKLMFFGLFSAFTLAVGSGLALLDKPEVAKAENEHNVIFDAQGGYFEINGSNFYNCMVQDGHSVDEEGKYPGNILHSNPDYVFEGWRDEALNMYPGPNAFFIPITRDITFTAGWRELGPSLLTITCDPADSGYLQNNDDYRVQEGDRITVDGTYIYAEDYFHNGHYMTFVVNDGYELDYWEYDGQIVPEYGQTIESVPSSGVNLIAHMKTAEHKHGDWSFSIGGQDNNALIATCGKSGCEDPAYKMSLTIKGPGHEVPYTGEPYVASYDEDEKTAFSSTFGFLPSINVAAESGSALTDGKAIEIGTYTFSIKNPKAEEYATYVMKIVDPNPPAPAPGPDPTPKEGLSGGAIAGIVIGSILLFLLLIFVVGYILWKKKDIKIPLLEKILTPAYRWVNNLLFKTKLNDVELKEETKQMEEQQKEQQENKE